jgi:RimJ/RimL family protein N-acetyltransferase
MTIIDNEIKLRPLAINDASALAEMANNRKIWDNIRDGMPHPYSLQDAWNFIAICENEEPILTYAIEYNHEFAGVIGLIQQYDVYRLSAELGFWLGEPFWNKGVATKAVQMIVNYGFEKLELIRIFSCVFESNRASRRVLEKAGFTFDAIFKNAIIKNGIVGNECRYSILKQ